MNLVIPVGTVDSSYEWTVNINDHQLKSQLKVEPIKGKIIQG